VSGSLLSWLAIMDGIRSLNDLSQENSQ